MIDQRIMDNHTNFIGKIVGININTATIQPLIMYKVYGEKAQRTAVLTDVPILCPYKYVYKVDVWKGHYRGKKWQYGFIGYR